MTHNELKHDNRDRAKVSATEDYEVEYLMTKFDLSNNYALELIIKHAGSRTKIAEELSQT